MPQTTAKGFKKPVDTDFADLKVFVGENMDLLETELDKKFDKTGGTISGAVIVEQSGTGSASASFRNTADDTNIRLSSYGGNNYIQSGNVGSTASKKLLITGHLGNVAPEVEINATNTKVNGTLQVGTNYAVASATSGLKLWKGTQAQYDAITTKDANTLYFISG